MKTTVLLTLDAQNAQFIRSQPDFTDPSAFINALFKDEMKRKGVVPDKNLKSRIRNDQVTQELETFLDADTPAAD